MLSAILGTNAPTTSLTPSIAFQAPPKESLRGYDSHRGPRDQPADTDVPKVFLDAMVVRERVFVREQRIPIQNEFDSDDSRSCHWVIYSPEQEGPSHSGSSGSPTAAAAAGPIPIGTIRLVPFPHTPHPKAGAHYVDGKEAFPPGADPPAPATPDAPEQQQQQQQQPDGLAPYGFRDRATSLHDGVEPYVKLGRLAVVPEMRGRRYGALLANAALDWMVKNQFRFDPALTPEELKKLGGDGKAPAVPPPRWNGLVCVHAQERAVSTWLRMGFEVDEKMGRWHEEGIPHVGMFRRMLVPKEHLLPARARS